MTEPIAFTTVRHLCPHCHRSRATRRAAVAHIARCWRNPGNRSCKTCAWLMPADGVSDEGCSKGVVIGKPREKAIEDAWNAWSAGWGAASTAPMLTEETPAPFPLNCDLWEAADD